MPASTATASTTATSARHLQATKARPTTTTSRAAKLDCEKEISRPNQVTTTAAAAASASRGRRPETTSTSEGTIEMTRNRPYTEGSQNTEFTRKNGAYAFAKITFGF